MVNVIMHGCNGKMGRNIAALIADDPEITLAAGVDAFDEGKNPFPVFKDIRDCDTEADVIIDFSAAPAVDNLLTYCEEKKVPCVLCTTGLSEEQLQRVEEVSKKVAILKSANMSLGINMLLKLLKEAAKTLGNINKLVSYISIAIIVLLLIISIFLISNTVSVGIAVRKEEIGIMKYIGATDAFVRAPFLLEGMVLGVVGAAVPLIVLYFCYNGAISYILTRFNVLTGVVDFIPVWQIYQTLLPISLGLGIGIGLIGSFFTTRKHLRV